TPLSALHFIRVLEEAGVPRGVVNLVIGSGTDVGAPLAKHRDVGVISFTGSSEVGALVAAAGGPGFCHVRREMGGKNVIIVMDDALIDLAVDGALWGGFGTSGQRCTAASRVIVHKKVIAEFTRKFVERTAKLKVGDGLDPSVDVGPVVNETQLERIQSYVRI